MSNTHNGLIPVFQLKELVFHIPTSKICIIIGIHDFCNWDFKNNKAFDRTVTYDLIEVNTEQIHNGILVDEFIHFKLPSQEKVDRTINADFDFFPYPNRKRRRDEWTYPPVPMWEYRTNTYTVDRSEFEDALTKLYNLSDK